MHDALRKRLLEETRQQVAAAVDDDQLIIQAVTMLEQLEHATNSLAKKAREWYGLFLPELDKAVKDHERFLELAATKTRSELLKELGRSTTMGAALAPEDEDAITEMIATIRGLYKERERLVAYLDAKLAARCPNLRELAGTTIAAKLLSHAGSLERLTTVPSSTIQLYGAETALFRHLRNKRKHRSPKYGLLFNHPLVQKVAQRDRGKAARALADKLSLCAKLDRFKGERKAAEYRKALAAKFTEW